MNTAGIVYVRRVAVTATQCITKLRRPRIQIRWAAAPATSHRPRLFSSARDNDDGASKATLTAHLTKLNVDSGLHDDVLKALESVYGKDLKVSHLDAFGGDGLRALARSIADENIKKGSDGNVVRPSKRVKFDIPHHQTSFELDWKLGDSILDLSRSTLEASELLSEYIEGACGGNASCSTCHVYVDRATYGVLPEPLEAEEDMLDLAYEPMEGCSRLGCQIKLGPELLQSEHDVVVTIPEGVNNMWD